jgi:hypothetical protein
MALLVVLVCPPLVPAVDLELAPGAHTTRLTAVVRGAQRQAAPVSHSVAAAPNHCAIQPVRRTHPILAAHACRAPLQHVWRGKGPCPVSGARFGTQLLTLLAGAAHSWLVANRACCRAGGVGEYGVFVAPATLHSRGVPAAPPRLPDGWRRPVCRAALSGEDGADALRHSVGCWLSHHARSN